MDWLARIAFILMLFEAISCLVMGTIYIVTPGVTSYHEQIMDEKFINLAPGIQKIITTFKGGTGNGAIQNGIILIILLFIPFMKKHRWTRWGIPVIELLHRGPFLYVALSTAISTGSSTPWQMQIFGIAASVLFFFFTGKYLSPKEKKQTR